MITPILSHPTAARVLPKLALDFTTGTLDPRVAFTRSLNTATRINSSGLVELVNADTPRFDYDPSTLAPRGLLVEATRTNKLLYSQELGNAVWVATNTNTTPDTTVAPDGTTTADTVSGVTAGANNLIYQTYTSTGSIISFSIWVKAGTATTCAILLRDATAAANIAVSRQIISGPGTATGTTIISLSGLSTTQWTRIAITSNAATTAGNVIRASFYPETATAASTTAKSNAVWGAQLEEGTTATSYIPTVAAPVTRNADVAAVTGTNFSSWWRPTTGAMLVRARQTGIATVRPLVHISDGTANNSITLRGNSADPELYIKATSDQAQIDAGTLVANTSYRLAGAWTTNDCAASLNSGTAVTDSSVTIPVVDQMLIGSDGTNYLNGWIEGIEYYDARLINPELQVVSSQIGYRSIIGPVIRSTIIR